MYTLYMYCKVNTIHEYIINITVSIYSSVLVLKWLALSCRIKIIVYSTILYTSKYNRINTEERLCLNCITLCYTWRMVYERMYCIIARLLCTLMLYYNQWFLCLYSCKYIHNGTPLFLLLCFVHFVLIILYLWQHLCFYYPCLSLKLWAIPHIIYKILCFWKCFHSFIIPQSLTICILLQ